MFAYIFLRFWFFFCSAYGFVEFMFWLLKKTLSQATDRFFFVYFMVKSHMEFIQLNLKLSQTTNSGQTISFRYQQMFVRFKIMIHFKVFRHQNLPQPNTINLFYKTVYLNSIKIHIDFENSSISNSNSNIMCVYMNCILCKQKLNWIDKQNAKHFACNKMDNSRK